MIMNVSVLKYKLLLISCVVLCGSFAQYDDVKKVLEKMTAYYENNENFQMQTTYKVHKGNLSGELLEVQQGVYRQYKKDEYSYVLGDHTMIQNKDHYFTVDHGMKRMMIALNSKEKENAPMLNFEESLELCSEVIHKGNKITFIYSGAPASGYSKVELEYNTNTYAIKRIVLYPVQKHYYEVTESEFERIAVAMEVRYGDVQKNSVSKKDLDVMGVYVQKQGKELLVTKKYSNYQLINQIP